MKNKGALYLIPVEISSDSTEMTIPAGNLEIVRGLRTFIVENLRTARRCLRHWDREFPIDDCAFYELNEHTDARDVRPMLDALRRGESVGVMSEAGCPGVADPGADIVAMAQREGLRVVPLVGPSSILLSLMGSGFNGQGFAFNGYLPVRDEERRRAVKELEMRAVRHGQTQIMIEAPYRNNKFLRMLAETLHGETLLCVACDVTDAAHEDIRTLTASQWRCEKYDFDKRPAIFLIGR